MRTPKKRRRGDARGCREQLTLRISKSILFFLTNFRHAAVNTASGARNILDALRPDVDVDERWTTVGRGGGPLFGGRRAGHGAGAR